MKQILLKSYCIAFTASAFILAAVGDDNTSKPPPGVEPPPPKAETRAAPPQTSVTWLGVSAEKTPPELEAHLGRGKDTGLLIRHVVPGSPAAIAGVKQYDILLRLDEHSLFHPRQLQDVVAGKKPDEVVSLTLLREGKEQQLKATLATHHFAADDHNERIILLGDGNEVDLHEILKEAHQNAHGAIKIIQNGQIVLDKNLNDIRDIQKHIHNTLRMGGTSRSGVSASVQDGHLTVKQNGKVILEKDFGLGGSTSVSTTSINGKTHVVVTKDGKTVYEADFDHDGEVVDAPRNNTEKTKRQNDETIKTLRQLLRDLEEQNQ